MSTNPAVGMSGVCAVNGGRGTGLATGEGPRPHGEGPGGQVEGLSFDATGPEAPLLAPGQGSSVLPAVSEPQGGSVLLPQVNDSRKVTMKVSDT